MDVLMPQLGETVSEGKVTTWFKSVGDTVRARRNLFEIETDKVTMEIQATEGGVLSEIRVRGRRSRAGRRGGCGHRQEAPPQRPAGTRGIGRRRRLRRARPRRSRRRRSPLRHGAPTCRSSSIRFSRCGRRRGTTGPARTAAARRRRRLRVASPPRPGIDISKINGSGPARRASSPPNQAAAPSAVARRGALPAGPSAAEIKALYKDAPFEEVPLDGDAEDDRRAGCSWRSRPCRISISSATSTSARCPAARGAQRCGRRATRTAAPPTGSRSTTSSSRPGRRRCRRCRRQTPCGRTIASCVSPGPTWPSRSPSRAA